MESDARGAKIFDLCRRDPLIGALQDELYAVIGDEKFNRVSIAAVVGVLEFLKWNLINRADS